MAYYPADASYLSRRGLVFAAIIVLHILAIWAFATGLADSGVRYVQTILQTSVIEPPKPKDLPPPPPPVDLKERPPVVVIAPVVNISVPVEAPPIINTAPPTAITPPPKAAPPAPLVWAKDWASNVPNTDDYYPPASQRANEEGRPVVHFCISAAGKLTSVALAQTSNFDRLDQAAVALIKATSRFKAPTQGGKPQDACRDLAIKFELKAK